VDAGLAVLAAGAAILVEGAGAGATILVEAAGAGAAVEAAGADP